MPVHSDHATGHHPALAHHFQDLDQQKDTTWLAMWVFLATEIMFFGGLFLAYVIYRSSYPDAFAIASNALDVKMGLGNTFVLIISSFTMAMSVYSAQVGKKTNLIVFLILTLILGGTFLGVKYFEYKDKFEHGLVPGRHFDFASHHDPKTGAALDHSGTSSSSHGASSHHSETGDKKPLREIQIFFSLYFAMTGLHAFHMIIGAGLLIWLIMLSAKNTFSKEYNSPVELVGLYWHFVDIVWIFLFPLLYLIGRHHH